VPRCRGGDASELERAQAVDDLLRRAYHGPPGDAGADAPGPAFRADRTSPGQVSPGDPAAVPAGG
jgi:hypothetical protein